MKNLNTEKLIEYTVCTKGIVPSNTQSISITPKNNIIKIKVDITDIYEESVFLRYKIEYIDCFGRFNTTNHLILNYETKYGETSYFIIFNLPKSTVVKGKKAEFNLIQIKIDTLGNEKGILYSFPISIKIN